MEGTGFGWKNFLVSPPPSSVKFKDIKSFLMRYRVTDKASETTVQNLSKLLSYSPWFPAILTTFQSSLPIKMCTLSHKNQAQFYQLLLSNLS